MVVNHWRERVPCVSTSINTITAPTVKKAVHNPALKIPAIAEHPAIRRRVHAKKNSTIGFIKTNLKKHLKKLCLIFLGNCGKAKFFHSLIINKVSLYVFHSTTRSNRRQARSFICNEKTGCSFNATRL